MNKGSFERIIAERGELIYSFQGNSMAPLLHERDLLVIKCPDFPLHRYDIPLYRRDTGEYVLHRILHRRKDDYAICGDNRYVIEYGITDQHIIGVLTHIIRDGKKISIKCIKYRVYAHLWCDLFVLRKIVMICRSYIKMLK